LTSSPSSETILVVDDDPEVVSVAADILRSGGYTVISTVEPRVVLGFARTHPDAIHLLLADVVMPLMSGVQLAAEFRAIRPSATVLFMSGYNESVEAYRVPRAPGEPFLFKPFTIDDLQSAVKAALVYRPPST
jgi:CheY-like chemotaxis protein